MFFWIYFGIFVAAALIGIWRIHKGYRTADGAVLGVIRESIAGKPASHPSPSSGDEQALAVSSRADGWEAHLRNVGRTRDDGQATTSAPELIGRYRVLNRIGGGGMGVVYRAYDPERDRPVAIKVIRGALGEQADVRQRFDREMRFLATLNHPNIAEVYDAGESQGQPFITMEYIEGETLDRYCSENRQLTLGRRVHILDQLCQGLHHAHQARIIHRDIKPGNLIVTPKWVLKIVDFGIARLAETGVTQMTFAGSVGYMSPEQINGKAVDHRSDIFAVGVVAYELLCCRKPFDADTTEAILLRTLTAEPRPLEDLVEDLDPDLIAAVRHALEKRPDDRFDDVEAMRVAMRQAVSRIDNAKLQRIPVLRVLDDAQARPSHQLPFQVVPKIRQPPPARPAPALEVVRRSAAYRTAQTVVTTGCGLLTSLLVALLLGVLHARARVPIFTFSVNLIPLGAIGSGVLAASGYYLGARVTEEKPTPLLLLNILGISAVTYFAVWYGTYEMLEVEGQPISRLIPFSTFFDAVVRQGSISFHTRTVVSEVGRLGYALAALQIVGFALGGLTVYGWLAVQPYCEYCGRYLASPVTVKGFSSFEQELEGTYQQSCKMAAAGNTMGAVSLIRTLPQQELTYQIKLNSWRCATCANEQFVIAFCRYTAGRWVTASSYRIGGLANVHQA